MNLSSSNSKLSIVLVASFTLILVFLAVLQYRWTGQISHSVRERMQASLDSSVLQFRIDFNRELVEIATSLQLENGDLSEHNWTRLAQQYQEWMSTALYDDLISNIYFWERSPDDPSKLFKLTDNEFEVVDWPTRLNPIRDASWLSMDNVRRTFRGSRNLYWFLFPSLYVLAHPVYDNPSREGSRGDPALLRGCIVVELDETVLCQNLIDELAQRYFAGAQGFVYQVAILSGSDPKKIIYRSNPGLEIKSFQAPDARIPLLQQLTSFSPRARPIEMPDQSQLLPPPENPPSFGDFPPSSTLSRILRRRGPLELSIVGENNNWELLVQHTQGSLDAAVANLHYRNLAVSFGILLLLALSMTMIIISTQRAKRLAELQMEFVAGVSHELRTPLTVICSAGENLADGVVDGSQQQVKQYGELIRAEGRRLSGMVEQILQFAKIKAGGKKYNLSPARVVDVIEHALEQAGPMIESEGFLLEKDIAADLPLAKVDAASLSQSLQNLINNALKYGGDNQWLRVSARSTGSDIEPEIQITVEDRGIGIDPADLPHIFDPFYRGSGATSSQIHGSGLGLSMAQDAIVAMGGRISVKSSPGEGSTFTIHLPAFTNNNRTT